MVADARLDDDAEAVGRNLVALSVHGRPVEVMADWNQTDKNKHRCRLQSHLRSRVEALRSSGPDLNITFSFLIFPLGPTF